MSGIDLFFKTAIDYERTHQLALLTILKETSLPSLLYPFIGEIKVDWEPERGLFDLAVSDAETTLYFELKMWSTLTENQRNRQIAFLKSNNSTCNYVLLGSTWFEFSEEKIHRESEKRAKKIGYEELEKLLNTLLTERGYSPDVYDLILAYRNALVDQFERQLDGWQSQV